MERSSHRKRENEPEPAIKRYSNLIREYRNPRLDEAKQDVNDAIRDYKRTITRPISPSHYSPEEAEENLRQLDQTLEELQKPMHLSSQKALKEILKRRDIDNEDRIAAYKKLSKVYAKQGNSVRSWYYNRKAHSLVLNRHRKANRQARREFKASVADLEHQLSRVRTEEEVREIHSSLASLYESQEDHGSANYHWKRSGQTDRLARNSIILSNEKEKRAIELSRKRNYWGSAKEFEEAEEILSNLDPTDETTERRIYLLRRAIELLGIAKKNYLIVDEDIQRDTERIEKLKQSQKEHKNLENKLQVGLFSGVALTALGVFFSIISLIPKFTGFVAFESGRRMIQPYGFFVFLAGLFVYLIYKIEEKYYQEN